MAEKHIVGYAIAYTSFHCYGERFDRLENACDKFERWFLNTGNTKYRSFNSRAFEERDGLNLTQRGGISLVLRIGQPIADDPISHCPFCGAEIVLKCTKSIALKEKTKQVPDGWEEIVRWEEPDQDTRVKEEFAKVTPPLQAEQAQEGDTKS